MYPIHHPRSSRDLAVTRLTTGIRMRKQRRRLVRLMREAEQTTNQPPDRSTVGDSSTAAARPAAHLQLARFAHFRSSGYFRFSRYFRSSTRFRPLRNRPILRGRIHLERPTRITLVIAGIFTALIGVPAVTAWAIHRTHAPSTPLVGSWIHSADAQVPVSVYQVSTGSITHVPLNTYIVNVLAAELPPNAPMPALQAAAVASRTYITYLITHRNSGLPTLASQHGADVTDDGLIDLPWLTQAQQAQKFGADTATYTARLQEAVITTDGQVLTYHGAPIPAFMFQLSPGRTRAASAVFNRSLPFLPAVACPDDASDPTTSQTLTFTPASLAAHLGNPGVGTGSRTSSAANSAAGSTANSTAKSTANSTLGSVAGTAAGTGTGNSTKGGAFASAGGGLNPAVIDIAARSSDGFVTTVNIRGTSQAWTGTDFANRLGLASTDFQLEVKGGNLVVRTRGVGTDIGMSLHEATVLAGQGETPGAILSHFYPGTKMESDAPFTAGR